MRDELSFKTSMEFAYGTARPVAPGIVRVVANNPGPMTFKGTNTYLVGMTELAVIDPGPDDPTHMRAILQAAAGRKISHILITHAHKDHVDGAQRLKAETGALIGANPRERAGIPTAASQGERTAYVNHDFAADVELNDGDTISGKEWSLEAVHTPGHAPDHLCFALRRRGIIFSGDHVMAWNTTVVAPPEGKMATFLLSLEKLLARPENKMYLPGHGGRLAQPRRTVKAYLLHRRWREETIVEALRSGATTIRSVVPAVYPEIDHKLLPAAALSVLAHVELLIEKGVVVCEGEPALDRHLDLS